jgi:outer membrane protein OmpA-like peptidoglycan-associated protein
MTIGAVKKTVCLAVAVSLAGCAMSPNQKGGVAGAINDTFNNEDPCSNNSRNLGILIGSLAGAVLVASTTGNKKTGAIAGAAIGGLFGGLIGADMDRRRCELSKIAKQYNLDLNMATITHDGDVLDDAALKRTGNADSIKKTAIGTVVSVRDQSESGGHFETNSDVLTARAREYFSAIADSYNGRKAAEQIANPDERAEYSRQIAQRKLLLIGHTDDTGPTALNADLSERRAKSVAQFLERQGIPRDSIYYQGAGETYPLADNNSEAGRAQNRRVEFVELADEATFQKYLAARKPRYEFYRAEVPTVAKVPAAKPAAVKGSTIATATKTPPVAAAKEAAVKAKTAATAAVPTSSPVPVTGKVLDFGGAPLTQAGGITNVGKLESKMPWFSLISTAYASEPAVLADCSKDRPRSSGAVRALKDGAVYKTSEHVRGLYGKSWTDEVNGHRIVINKVAVLANEATLAQVPEFKVYANYDPKVNRNPAPDVAIAPEVNTYLGSNGILYRIFANGNAGVQCVDILFPSEGGGRAKTGKLIYAHDAKLYVADFKPSMVN